MMQHNIRLEMLYLDQTYIYLFVATNWFSNIKVYSIENNALQCYQKTKTSTYGIWRRSAISSRVAISSRGRDRIAVAHICPRSHRGCTGFPAPHDRIFCTLVIVWLKPRPRLRRHSVELWVQKSVRSSRLCIRAQRVGEQVAFRHCLSSVLLLCNGS